MKTMTYISQGDMRKAINALQGAVILSREITRDTIYAITSTARPDGIEDCLAFTFRGL